MNMNLHVNFTGLLNRWITTIVDSEQPAPKPLPELSTVIEEARQEWLAAQHYYNTVTDRDLVDHAVFMMQAAEKKYIYLLKKARQEGVTFSPYHITSEDVHSRANL